MAKTLEGILNDIAAYLDQDTTLATGTELTVRVNLIDQALQEWAEAYQWKQLRKPFAPTVLLSMTSIGLNQNFKKFMSPLYDMSRTSDNEYREISPSDRFNKAITDKYFIVGGDEASGKYININPALVSGASLVGDFQSFPSSMATLQDICVCPAPTFLTKRTIANILSARSDPRFPTLKAEADDSLANMIEEEAVFSGAQDNRTPDTFRRNNFVMGED